MKEVKVEDSAGSAAGAAHPKRGFKPKARTATVHQPKSEGRRDGLKDHTESYNTSIKELAEYDTRIYTYGGYISRTVENEKIFPVPCPPYVETDAGAMVNHIWERCIDGYFKRDNKLPMNCETMYYLVLGQCSEYIRATLEGLINYEDTKRSFNVITLIKAIKGLSYQFDGQTYHYMALHQAKKRFYNLFQGREMMNTHLLDKFYTCVTIVEKFRGDTLGRDYTAINSELEAIGIVDTKKAVDTHTIVVSDLARVKYLAVTYISVADKTRHGRLFEDLESDFTKGSSNCSVSITSAYNVVINYKNNLKAGIRLINDTEGVSCANVENKQVDRSKVKCYNFNILVHYANECTEEKNEKADGRWQESHH
jgi:hypothetical protein